MKNFFIVVIVLLSVSFLSSISASNLKNTNKNFLKKCKEDQGIKKDFFLKDSDEFPLIQHDGRFLSCQPDGKMQANRNWYASWERFTVEEISEGLYAIKSVPYNKYLTWSNGLFRCDSTTIGTNQQIKIAKRGDGITLFNPTEKKWASAKNADLNSVITLDEAGDKETFFPAFFNKKKVTDALPKNFCADENCTKAVFKIKDTNEYVNGGSTSTSKVNLTINQYEDGYITILKGDSGDSFGVDYYNITPDGKWNEKLPELRFSLFKVMKNNDDSVYLKGYGGSFLSYKDGKVLLGNKPMAFVGLTVTQDFTNGSKTSINSL